MNYTIEKYKLELIDSEMNKCKIVLCPKEGQAFLKERRKLYIVYHNNEILYIGETNTSLKTRFQRGCTSFNYLINNGKARSGYKGYKWLNKKENSQRILDVSVITFTQEYDNNREIIEAIEGELVYLIRNKLGYWPKFQNEIHFSNNSKASELAINIFSKILNF